MKTFELRHFYARLWKLAPDTKRYGVWLDWCWEWDVGVVLMCWRWSARIGWEW